MNVGIITGAYDMRCGFSFFLLLFLDVVVNDVVGRSEVDVNPHDNSGDVDGRR
jgi:hypothetical protein